MTTIDLVIAVLLIALAIWLIPMREPLVKILYAVAIICFIVWLLGVLGIHIP